MENTAEEDDLSSMANHLSFSGDEDGRSAASEESGWTTYIDYFMETQRRQQQQEEAISDSATDDIHGVGSGAMPAVLVEPSSEVSGRLRLGKKEGSWRKKKKLVYDESLEDTATSPINSPKLIDSRDSYGKHKKIEDACYENSDIAEKTITDELDCDNSINIGTDTRTDMIINDDKCGPNDNQLRKKGLCLVPMSFFHA